MRLTDCTVLSNHLHFIVELDPTAPDAPGKDLPPKQAAKQILARGVRGLLIRIAKGLNRLWGRKGRVFADRYHAAPKTTPRAVRNAKRYVLFNAHRHFGLRGIDDFSSGPWFDGWSRPVRPPLGPSPFAEPRTWLGRVGWLRHGRIAIPA